MKDFAGRIAVVTGGGTGMGRELVRQLVAEGCNVAMCDVSADAMAETKRLCEVEKLPQGLRVTTHVADVSIEDQLERFRDEVAELQATDRIHLLFNNAGIGGGGSLFTNTREQWERTFNICWGGVYLGVRTFLPMLLKADQAHIVNTSSVNGFWASVGLGVAHTAYSAAKFAVKGFTEALINDLRLNAPHIKCSVVMPGHIGTSIVSNTRKVQSGTESDRLNPNEILQARQRLQGMGTDTSAMSDEDIQGIALDRARTFRDEAPMTAAAAAKVILDGVKAERWRILIGEDAHQLDARVRRTPERRRVLPKLCRRSRLAAWLSATASLPRDALVRVQPVGEPAVTGAIGQAIDRPVAAETEVVIARRVDRPAAALLAQVEQ
jgi:NAD(P)-dependent dehydrogenase (short-subunit alcohol dehydrogenase family)